MKKNNRGKNVRIDLPNLERLSAEAMKHTQGADDDPFCKCITRGTIVTTYDEHIQNYPH